MINIIVIAVILIIVGSAALYIYKAKKRGEKCVGCPYAKGCAGKSCGCAGKSDSEPPHKNKDIG